MKFLLFVFAFAVSVHALCSSSSDCNHNGICEFVSSECVCFPGFTTHITACDYQLKSQTTTLLLQVVWGFFGIAHFYIGRNDIGIAKCVLFCLSFFIQIVMMVLIKKLIKDDDDAGSTTGRILMIIYHINRAVIAFWWFVDICLFTANYYPDNNGHYPYSWGGFD